MFTTNSQNLLKLVPIELVMPSYHLILCHVLLLLPSIFPSIRVFSNESGSVLMSQFFASDGQSIGALASVLPMDIASTLFHVFTISCPDERKKKTKKNPNCSLPFCSRAFLSFCPRHSIREYDHAMLFLWGHPWHSG